MPATAKVFFAFPYEFGEPHRIALREGARLAGADAVFADEVPRPTHILNNVSTCIEETDAGFYDVTGHNENVLVEFGIGYGSGKPSFLIVNEQEHVVRSGAFGGRTAIPTPTDLQGIIRIPYRDTGQLRVKLRDAIKQFVLQQPRFVNDLSGSVLGFLERSGASTMSQIADGIARPIDDVRPVIGFLMKTDRVVKEGHARTTRYLLPSQSTQQRLF